ncbi:hypothetical protein [Adhaeribacter arboris]|nr:hypothetical protein [Adhaeribacter arboris]
MIKPSKKLTVTGILNNSGRITAFFNEMPGLVVQGISEEDVKDKLIILLDAYIIRLESMKNNLDIQTTSLA